MKRGRAKEKTRLLEMVYSIDSVTYLPNESQIKEVDALIKYEHLFPDEIRSYLSAPWN